MMRPILIAVILLLLFLCIPAYGQSGNSILETLDTIPREGTFVVFEYLWVYGITERVQIRGDGLLRVERHVHDGKLFDGLRAELAEKGELTPYGKEIYTMEEGEYDRYWVTDIGDASFDAFLDTLTEGGFPDIVDTFGDWEVWAVTLRAGDTKTRVGRVVRDTHDGFETILMAIEGFADIAKDAGEVDKEEFLDWFDELKADQGGAS